MYVMRVISALIIHFKCKKQNLLTSRFGVLLPFQILLIYDTRWVRASEIHLKNRSHSNHGTLAQVCTKSTPPSSPSCLPDLSFCSPAALLAFLPLKCGAGAGWPLLPPLPLRLRCISPDMMEGASTGNKARCRAIS